MASEVWELWADGSAKAGDGAEVEDAGIPVVGAKEEGTSAALSVVFLASGKLIVWSFAFQQFLMI